MKSETTFPKRAGAILAAFVLLIVVGECGYKKLQKTPLDWKTVLKSIRKDYPAVTQMSTAEYAALVETNGAHVLLDAREPEEFAVSRIPRARNLRTVDAVKAAGIPADARIVLYCSVGYRSSALADNLRGAGYGNVANLEGSLFAWANEGRPVVGAQGKETTRVHPYSDRWGALLDRSVVTVSEK